jgi:hypothetical protein
MYWHLNFLIFPAWCFAPSAVAVCALSPDADGSTVFDDQENKKNVPAGRVFAKWQ